MESANAIRCSHTDAALPFTQIDLPLLFFNIIDRFSVLAADIRQVLIITCCKDASTTKIHSHSFTHTLDSTRQLNNLAAHYFVTLPFIFIWSLDIDKPTVFFVCSCAAGLYVQTVFQLESHFQAVCGSTNEFFMKHFCERKIYFKQKE